MNIIHEKCDPALAKDKKIGKRWKITKAAVSEAFPSIQWGGRS